MASLIDLESIYFRVLEACAPERLVRRVLRSDFPRTVVAIGKCAGALLDGLGDFSEAFAAIPAGYPAPHLRMRTTAGSHPRDRHRHARIARGGHPEITAESFAAGREMLDFVDAHEDVLFLISGGGSACVELPLEPWFEERDLIEVNARLLGAGLPIGEMNCVRKHLSAIKGGRLAARVRGQSVTLIYSDVSTGALADVASGPTLPDPTSKQDAIAILQRVGGCDRIVTRLADERCPETVKHVANSRVELVADNVTLTEAAAEIAADIGYVPVRWEKQIDSDVESAAQALAVRARELREREVLIAGGEPTVVRRGDGKGGRCSELAVRLALAAHDLSLTALFGSSDGLDGNSGVAAVALTLPVRIDRRAAENELARSNALAVAQSLGRVIAMVPTGNNLRDLYLLARS
jgi:glycerate 2-kinase